MGPHVLTAGVLALTAAILLVLGFGSTGDRDAGADAAQRAALRWTGAELADAPRRGGDAWEVDVRRVDGSLVEVGLGPRLDLRELDEELGAGGTPAHDVLTGALRERAIAAARPASGPGPVRSVERERDGSIEVDVERPGRIIVEVELDRRLRVTDVDEEDWGDE
jgi:hypothetical protein